MPVNTQKTWRFRETVAAGDWLFREGDRADRAYVIEDGSVEIVKSHNGRDHVVNTLATGEIFGEMALIDGGVRSAGARAVTATVVLAVPADSLAQIMRGSHPLALRLAQILVQRLRDQTDALSRSA